MKKLLEEMVTSLIAGQSEDKAKELLKQYMKVKASEIVNENALTDKLIENIYQYFIGTGLDTSEVHDDHDYERIRTRITSPEFIKEVHDYTSKRYGANFSDGVIMRMAKQAVAVIRKNILADLGDGWGVRQKTRRLGGRGMEVPTRGEDRPGSGYERHSDDTRERDGMFPDDY